MSRLNRRQRRARLAPDLPFPGYSYVPGLSPHPTSSPEGHSFGSKISRPEPPIPEEWHTCRPYLYGIDLFNHGYYWEAHEVWESLWHACGRKGRNASFLKGLIKLAAAGVKVREGKPDGVRSHARRAAELFRQMASDIGTTSSEYMGLDLNELIHYANDVSHQPPTTQAKSGEPVEIVFDCVLEPAPSGI